MMGLIEFIQNQYTSAIAGGIGGVLTAWLTQRVLNKRGTFTYFVNHQMVGQTTEDAVFGSVTVSLNGNPISNLYLSTVELKNESMNDYENVVINIYTDDTKLLSERTQILDTPRILEWSDKFKGMVHVDSGNAPTQEQWNIFNTQREYVVPIINRGQSIRFTYLNSANGPAIPNIWLSAVQKGVKVAFRVPQSQILGIPQPRAAFMGVFVGIAMITYLVLHISDPWTIAFVSFLIGLFAVVPGAYTIKIIRKLREIIGG